MTEPDWPTATLRTSLGDFEVTLLGASSARAIGTVTAHRVRLRVRAHLTCDEHGRWKLGSQSWDLSITRFDSRDVSWAGTHAVRAALHDALRSLRPPLSQLQQAADIEHAQDLKSARDGLQDARDALVTAQRAVDEAQARVAELEQGPPQLADGSALGELMA